MAMRILGIDPGLTRTGIGLIDGTDVQHPQAVEWMTIATEPTLPTPLRLTELSKDLNEILKECNPSLAVVEKLFFSTNTRTAMQTAEARGVILLALQSAHIPIVEVTPLQLKMSITGDGNADKKQMQSMVMRILHLKKVPEPADAADALALALFGLYTSTKTSELIAR